MIKNYTSEVAANRSVLHIEERLVQNKAKNIMKIYENERLQGIAFIVFVNGTDFPFKLPARLDRVEAVLLGQRKHFQKGTRNKIKDQAERTAWKILSDWVDIQMSLVELDQAELVEVFMPYLYNHKKEQTFFDQWKENGFMQIEDRREDHKK
jgi:hypothetical protein